MKISTRVVLVIAIGMSLLLMSPTLFQGFIIDDPMVLASLEERYPERPAAFDVYTVLHDQWELPWWTAEDFALEFARPLSSALLRLDYAVFGRWAPGWHLHSLLWLGLFLVVLTAFYQRLDPHLYWLAVLVFALDESSSFTAGWISNRHSLVAMTFGVAALLAHLRWRDEGWRPGLPLSCAGFVLALLASETGLVALGFVAAYELFASPGDLRQKWRGILPVAAIFLMYASWYGGMGYGVHGGAAIYVDPRADPSAFFKEAGIRIPVLLGGGILGSPPHLWMQPTLRPLLAGIGLVAVLLLAFTLKAGWSSVPEGWQRHLRWLLPGAFLSCLPLVAAFPSHRQLIGPMLGLAPALAVMLFLAIKVWWPRGGRSRLAAASLGFLLILVHGLQAPAVQATGGFIMQAMHNGFLQNLASVPHWNPADGFREVVVLQGPDGMTTFYGPVLLDDLHQTKRGRWTVLSVAPFDHRWTRTGPRGLRLELLNGEMFTTFPEVHYPSRPELAKGNVVTFREVRIEILETGTQGPKTIHFEMPFDLDDPKILLLVWQGQKFERFVVPPIGQSVDLPTSPSFVTFP